MAKNEYVILIKNETGSSGKSTTAKTPKSQDKQEPNSSKELKKGVLKGISYVKIAENFADKIVQYNFSTISLRTGQTHYQQKLQFRKDVIKSTADTLIYSVLAGALTGNIAVAGFGILAGAASSMIDIVQKQNTIDIKRQVENQTINRNNIRAGASGSRLTAIGSE